MISWERLAGLSEFVFIGLFIVAFALGIEVGESDREILEYYADNGNRVEQVVAFFLIAAAALTLVVFAGAASSPWQTGSCSTPTRIGSSIRPVS